jgi:ketosteroid isomerase-like protein
MLDSKLESKHAAQRASFASPQRVKEKDKAGWLELFADDAVVQDPVGPSHFDPSGQGHRGKDAIGRFWDIAIGTVDFDFDIQQSYPCGDECANVWVGKITAADGSKGEVPMVTIYRVNDAGKITSLRAFWNSQAQ